MRAASSCLVAVVVRRMGASACTGTSVHDAPPSGGVGEVQPPAHLHTPTQRGGMLRLCPCDASGSTRWLLVMGLVHVQRAWSRLGDSLRGEWLWLDGSVACHCHHLDNHHLAISRAYPPLSKLAHAPSLPPPSHRCHHTFPHHPPTPCSIHIHKHATAQTALPADLYPTRIYRTCRVASARPPLWPQNKTFPTSLLACQMQINENEMLRSTLLAVISTRISLILRHISLSFANMQTRRCEPGR